MENTFKMRKLYLFVIISFLFDCNFLENKKLTYSRIRSEFIDKASKLNLDCLMGFSLSTRGELDNGDKYIRGTFLTYGTDYGCEGIVLPSFQIIDEDKTYTLDTSLSLRFVTELGLDTTHHYQYTKNRIDCVTETFVRLHIFGMMSQPRLGEFIEFEIYKDCSIWYKKDGAWLNDIYKSRFEKAKKIATNWYIVPDYQPQEHDTITKYNISGGDTIFLDQKSTLLDDSVERK